VERLQLERCRHEDIIRQEPLGEGVTFRVEKCEHKKEVFALKNIKLGAHRSGSAAFQRRLTSVMLELQIMHHQPLRNHPNILSLCGYGWNTQKQSILPYILVEYSPFGTLREYVREQKGLSMLFKEIFMADVASGLNSLHNTGIVHGDVKLDNVLVFQSWDRPVGTLAKISDFGHSIVLTSTTDGERHARYSGTPVCVIPKCVGLLADSSQIQRPGNLRTKPTTNPQGRSTQVR
jgi:serine/threonine protein kinase